MGDKDVGCEHGSQWVSCDPTPLMKSFFFCHLSALLFLPPPPDRMLLSLSHMLITLSLPMLLFCSTRSHQSSPGGRCRGIRGGWSDIIVNNGCPLTAAFIHMRAELMRSSACRWHKWHQRTQSHALLVIPVERVCSHTVGGLSYDWPVAYVFVCMCVCMRERKRVMPPTVQLSDLKTQV